jgi:hypothetical protein
MNENDEDPLEFTLQRDFSEWIQHRRDTKPAGDLTDRILNAVQATEPVRPVLEPRRRTLNRVGPVVLWTAACLVFVARLMSLVGNLVFPTSSYPEFAVDRIEEPTNERHGVSRS